MKIIDEKINELISELDYNVICDMFACVNSGKKLRSKLVLKIAGENEKSVTLCAVIELIHLASLLHDDVIDEANLRRNNPSINALFGAKSAIMLGDILYSKGFFELVKFGENIAGIVSDAVSKLSIGELMDVKMSENFNDCEESYLKMVYYKTAVLIQAASHSAAILAAFSDEKCKNYAQYGKNLGIAFQIIDDILDITSDEKTLGKPAMADFKEGKTTLPYILLFKNQNESEKNTLKTLFKKELNKDEKIWLKEQFSKYKAIENSIKIAKDYAKKALNSVDNVELQSVVNDMINREF